MSGVRRAGATHRPPGLEAFPGATAKIRWMDEATAGHRQGCTAPAPVPGMISLMADPEDTPLQQGGAPEGDRGALMMRIAVAEEGLGEDEEEEEEDGGTNRPTTLNMNLDRNQEHATP